MSATQVTDGLGNTAMTTVGEWLGDTTVQPYGDFYPSTGNYYISPWAQTVIEPPRECSGDVHVFPCPHCDQCKCGGAKKIVAKDRKK
jgi:hypothetical protein